jgi:hypothetical protein
MCRDRQHRPGFPAFRPYLVRVEFLDQRLAYVVPAEDCADAIGQVDTIIEEVWNCPTGVTVVCVEALDSAVFDRLTGEGSRKSTAERKSRAGRGRVKRRAVA